MREKAKSIIGASDFYEIYIATNLHECKKRDTKGLYEKAIRGEIKNFTGISAPYEKPNSPNLVVPTENISIEESSEILYNFAIPLITKKLNKYQLSHLEELEAESIFVIREVASQFEKPVLLFSGKILLYAII